MKKGLTELVFVLDRSGSMSGLEKDTIGGYNALLKKQQSAEGEAVVTTVLFDNHIELLHDRIDIRGVSPVTERDYYVRGSTALLDAMGMAIEKTINARRKTAEAMQPENTLIAIITDGLENASRRFTYEQVHALVTQQRERWKWEFLFIGANMDAIAQAQRFGIAADRAVTRHNDTQGTQIQYEALEKAAAPAMTVSKTRYSAFFGTDLDLVLRENGVSEVVVVGTKTNCCIRATVTDAYNLDYRAIVLSDCVATDDPVVNRVHLTDIRKYLGRVMSSAEFFARGDSEDAR